MSKNIKSTDVLHYYIGCRCRYEFLDGTVVYGRITILSLTGLAGLDVDYWVENGELTKPKENGDFCDIDNFNEGKLQLILTHSTNLTKEQKAEYKGLCYAIRDLVDEKDIVRYADTPSSMRYLFEQYIDAFDLIENEEALDLQDMKTLLKLTDS